MHLQLFFSDHKILDTKKEIKTHDLGFNQNWMGVHERMSYDINQDRQFDTANNWVNCSKGFFNQ